jgi:hypothetical protein
MTFVVSFEDFTPEPRFDNVSWTKVQIEEAATVDGTYTIIEANLAIDVDADPSEPAGRSFTTTHATLQQCWYRITFKDNAGGLGPVAPVQAIASGEAGFLPTPRDVGLKILSRTRDKYGNQVGTFNADTQPSSADVLGIINQAGMEVADSIGDTIPAGMYDDVSNLIALRAAMDIEMSYFSDQVNTGRSIYPQLEKEYERQVNIVGKQISSILAGGGTDPVNPSAALAPTYSFPVVTDDLMTKRF